MSSFNAFGCAWSCLGDSDAAIQTAEHGMLGYLPHHGGASSWLTTTVSIFSDFLASGNLHSFGILYAGSTAIQH